MKILHYQVFFVFIEKVDNGDVGPKQLLGFAGNKAEDFLKIFALISGFVNDIDKVNIPGFLQDFNICLLKPGEIFRNLKNTRYVID